MSDLELDRTYKRNDQGPKVKLIQEWLCLNGVQVKLDEEFGPATEAAVKLFQTKSKLTSDGVVGPKTFTKLIQPMTNALKSRSAGTGGLGALVVQYARQHLASRPREIGGENSGPWVRLYMDGKEGTAYAWCAGFACFILKQACTSVGSVLPIRASVSCDELAASAQQRGVFLAGGIGVDHTRLTPGSFFLNRRTDRDWVHTGIVTRVEPEAFQTIEGNTNDEGAREGYEVCQRVRPFGARDFILIGN